MTDRQWEKYKPYFKPSEFDSPDVVGSGQDMNFNFMEKLLKARMISGVLYKISSGYRTPARNTKVGGTSGSSHMLGLACDIHFSNNHQRFKILQGLIKAGFVRLGLGHTYIHVDNDENKTQDRAWDYVK